MAIWPRNRLRCASSSARLTALAQLPRELVEPRFERLDRRGHLGLDVARGPAAQPAQQLERHEDADDERYSETDG